MVHNLKEKGGTNGAMNPGGDVINKVKGKGKKKESPSAIYDKDGKLLEGKEDIKNRHKEYFSELLVPKQSETEAQKQHEDFVNEFAERIILIGELATSKQTTDEEIGAAIKSMKKKKCADPEGWKNEFILDGGEPMVQCVGKMLEKIGKEKKIPTQWSNIMIRALNKTSNTTKMELKRGIFITNCISKIFEKIIKNRNKESIDRYISPFQTGDKKNRSGLDTIMLTNATITKNRRLGKNTYLLFGDAVKCFDKLWLRSCILELYRAGVDVSDIFFIYCLNKKSNVMIKTSVGDTDYIEIGETVKQGSILGPTIACLETDAVNRMEGDHVTMYSNGIGIGVPVHVDDISKSGDPVDINITAEKMNTMENFKKFSFGLKKTKWMVIYTSRKKQIVEVDVKVSGGKIGRAIEYKLLGFWLNEKGNCELQIEKNGKKVEGKTSAVKTLITPNSVGSEYINVRLIMFECCLIASLLYGLEAWNSLSKSEYDDLEKIQGLILRRLLDLPQNTSYEGILIELGIWKARYTIYYRKIMLCHNIMHSDDERPIKQVILAQKESEEEGTFWEDVSKILKEIKFNGDIQKMKKSETKKEAKKRIGEMMNAEMDKASKDKTKIRFCKVRDHFVRKEYTKEAGKQVVQTLITKLNMQPVYGNFKGDMLLPIMCPLCLKCEDTTEHLLSCTEGCGSIEDPKTILEEDENIEQWRWINRLIENNFDKRKNIL